MKILHVIWSIDPGKGGPPSALVRMAKAQVRLGMDVSIVATWCKGENVEAVTDLQQCGVKVQLIGPCTGPLRWHRKVSSVIRAAVANSDVVHIHGLWEEINHSAACAAKQFSVPYIIRPCGMLDPWSLAQSRLRKQFYMSWRLRKHLDGAAAIHFTSQGECDLVSPLQIVASSIVEPNGVDLEEFVSLPSYGTFRNKYPMIGNRLLVAFLGRIHPGKGLEVLIPALAKLKRDDVILAIVGPDSRGYRAKIETMITANGLQDSVIFTDILKGEDKVAALSDADLFALPSHHENFGVAVVEALAAGTPVVISDQVNIHDQITAAKVGGVTPLDVNAFAQELDRWLSNEELRNETAERTRPFVQAQYDWTKIAQRWRGHYVRLAGESVR